MGSASLTALAPAALPGLTVGAQAEVRRRMEGGWYAAARLTWDSADGANTEWAFTQQEPALAALAGREWPVGPGVVRVSAGAGVRVVRQDVQRQQFVRLTALGMTGIEHSNWTVSPGALAEVAVALVVYGPLSVEVGGGPWAGALRQNGATKLDLSGQGRVGAVLAF
jgi:hypothetical protein